MGTLRKLQCEQCAGIIDGTTMKCQSCGMQYRLDEDFTLGRVEVYNGKFVTLEGKIGVPAYTMYKFGEDGPRKACEMTLKALSEGMAKKILPFMEFQQYYDPRMMHLETYASVRVAEPRTRFDPGWMINEFGRHIK